VWYNIDTKEREVNKMKCIECNYYWIDEGNDYYTCHCTEPEGEAPCEWEDDEIEEEEDEE
jgi:hypothetical protein